MKKHTFKEINESNRKLLTGLSATPWRRKKTGNLYVIESLTMLQADYKPYDERTLVNYHSMSEEEGAASCVFSRLLAEFMCKFVPVHEDVAPLDLSAQMNAKVEDIRSQLIRMVDIAEDRLIKLNAAEQRMKVLEGLLGTTEDLVFTAIKRMRAGHVACLDLQNMAEEFIRAKSASLKGDET